MWSVLAKIYCVQIRYTGIWRYCFCGVHLLLTSFRSLLFMKFLNCVEAYITKKHQFIEFLRFSQMSEGFLAGKIQPKKWCGRADSTLLCRPSAGGRLADLWYRQRKGSDPCKGWKVVPGRDFQWWTGKNMYTKWWKGLGKTLEDFLYCHCHWTEKESRLSEKSSAFTFSSPYDGISIILSKPFYCRWWIHHASYFHEYGNKKVHGWTVTIFHIHVKMCLQFILFLDKLKLSVIHFFLNALFWYLHLFINSIFNSTGKNNLRKTERSVAHVYAR